MPKTIQQVVRFPVPPGRLYRLYLSAREHAEACGGWGRSTITPRVGGRMTMAPYIRGTFLRLVPDCLIVQTWRGDDWKESGLDSILVLAFYPDGKGSRLVMAHANLPDAHARSIASGWCTYYWRPWAAYLRRRRATPTR